MGPLLDRQINYSHTAQNAHFLFPVEINVKSILIIGEGISYSFPEKTLTIRLGKLLVIG